jgi:hypothetical protein
MTEQTKTILTKIFIILVLLAALAAVWQWRTVEQRRHPEPQSGIVKNDSPGVGGPEGSTPDAIIVEHSYNNGTHTLAGTISLPNPCYGLKTDVAVEGSSHAILDITTTPPEPDQMCIQVIDEREFRTIFTAGQDITLAARYNGVDVSLVTRDGSGTLQPSSIN